MPQTLLDWVKREQISKGQHEGLTSSKRERLRQLERENEELRQANEILKLVGAFFAQAALSGFQSGDVPIFFAGDLITKIASCVSGGNKSGNKNANQSHKEERT